MRLVINKHEHFSFIVRYYDYPYFFFSSDSLKECFDYINANYSEISENYEYLKLEGKLHSSSLME